MCGGEMVLFFMHFPERYPACRLMFSKTICFDFCAMNVLKASSFMMRLKMASLPVLHSMIESLQSSAHEVSDEYKKNTYSIASVAAQITDWKGLELDDLFRQKLAGAAQAEVEFLGKVQAGCRHMIQACRATRSPSGRGWFPCYVFCC